MTRQEDGKVTRWEIKMLKMERKGDFYCDLYLFPLLEHLSGCTTDHRPVTFLVVRSVWTRYHPGCYNTFPLHLPLLRRNQTCRCHVGRGTLEIVWDWGSSDVFGNCSASGWGRPEGIWGESVWDQTQKKSLRLLIACWCNLFSIGKFWAQSS